MRRFFASLDASLCAAGRWLIQPLGTRIAVVTMLSIHAGLLAYSATRHGPTHLEPAFLVSGISHWQFGRFELYRVNPPLPRMIAALPVLVAGYEADWSRFHDSPGSRAEFPVGEDFIKANGPRSVLLFFCARWACIPFSLVGGYVAYRWANALYGSGSGLLTLSLWTFEPNLLAHAELVTPDCACWSFGLLAGYSFWRWLKKPSWPNAIFAGVSLGLAELTKQTWIILFALWPFLWTAWQWLAPRDTHAPARRPPARQLIAILFVAVYLLNLGYGFDGSFTQLKRFQFVSTALTGLEQPRALGNRFRHTLLGEIPVPVPKQFVLGFDTQKKDFEYFGQRSYLRGQWSNRGWWYYYIYGLLVKVPCGIWGLLAVVVVRRFASQTRSAPLRDELVLLAPVFSLLALASSQTEFSHHLRYVFPCIALGLVFLGQGVVSNFNFITTTRTPFNYVISRTFDLPDTPSRSSATFLVLALASSTAASTLCAFPHHLAYFNDFVGGPHNGWKHLLGSSFDWGQDLLAVNSALEARGEKAVVTVNMPLPYEYMYLSLLRHNASMAPTGRAAKSPLYIAAPFDGGVRDDRSRVMEAEAGVSLSFEDLSSVTLRVTRAPPH